MNDSFKDIEKHLKHLDSGDLIWISKKRGRPQFSVAGTICYAKNNKNLPAIRVKYNLKIHQATHIIIYLAYGIYLKKGQIVDHIDGNPLNNRLENIRICDYKTNNKNKKMQKNNTSGVTGVRYSSALDRFTAIINGRSYTFKTLLDACAKRKSLEISTGYTERHGM